MKQEVPRAGMDSFEKNGRLNISLSGRLDAVGVASLWPRLEKVLRPRSIRSVEVDGRYIGYCDGTGTSLLVYIRKQARRRDLPVEFNALPETVASMLALYPEEKIIEVLPAGRGNWVDLVERIGETFCRTMQGLKEHVAFLGELTVNMFRTLLNPGSLRVKDFLVINEACGPQALPIVSLLGFLIGLIIAFQGATLMKQFGAEIYIADSAGLLMTRELGPLITAILVAGRTGSAFAAEIGTMKVNEEIDALTTMGLNPARYLVVPRVLAASIMTPLLAVFANLAGIAGGAVVMLSMGYPLVTYVNRLLEALSMADYLSGLFKALVFGILIASAGCLCGLKTGEGASAVGTSATRAVVSSILLIVLADGVFAVLFYYLGI